MKKTIIVSAFVALLVNFLCAYPFWLFICIWVLFGTFVYYVVGKLSGLDNDFATAVWCYILPPVTLLIALLIFADEFYREFPNFPHFRSPIYFKKEE